MSKIGMISSDVVEWEPGMKNCYNLGEIISSHNQVAGICCTPIYSLPQNCYNAGIVEGGDEVAPIYTGLSNLITGITGEIINCYCVDKYKPVINDGGRYNNDIAIYLTSEEMKEGASLLGDAFCNDEDGINKGYPILKWQKK